MKKYLFTMSAVAMLFATSCQNDLDIPQGAGETATVAFNISTPEIATRAYSDGTTATRLQYAVYDAAGKHLAELDGTAIMENLRTTIDIKLTTGNTYNVIFWAAAEGAPYAFNSATKEVTVDYSDVTCNNEAYDAFYTRSTFQVKGAQTEDVVLTRPFAQINIGTNDYEDSRKAGYVPTESTVTVSNIYNVLNLWEGDVTGETSVEFEADAIDRNEDFPVLGYEYIAMNYVLVPKNKKTVEVTFGYGDDSYKTRTVGSVPVQRNFRTNIYGQLLTSDVDINVTINPIYNKPDYTVFEAFENGGTVTLTEDVAIDRTLVVKEGVKAVLNLNGHKIINNTESTDLGIGDGIIVYGDLTINGEGTIQGNTRAIWARSNTGAKVRINGGNYVGAVGGACEVIYASGNGVIDIYGGTFEAKTQDTNSFAAPQYAVLNLHGNGKDGCDIKVYGGAFKNFNPADNISENPKHNFCAEGYTAVEKDGWYVVGKAVSNVAELKDALSNAPVVNVEQAIDNGSNVLTINGNNLELNMEGNKITAGGQSTNNYAFNVYGSNVTVNNANVDGAGFAVMQESNLTINDGAINAKPGKSGRNMFYVTGNSTVTVKEGDYKFDRTSCYFVYVEAGCTCVIEGGNFYKPLANNASKDSFVNNGSTGTVIITGGTFNVDPSPWVATGYKAVKNGSIWTVVAK